MSVVRPAAVAGTFYPRSPAALAADIHARLARAAGEARSDAPKALIVPHAGYVYSGAVAASAYARLTPARDTIRRVVIFGPAHRYPVRGLALPSASAFMTPLGSVAIDRAAADAALALAQVCESDAAHALEHSLEVQLPFLQTLLDAFTIVPFAVGDATTDEVAEAIDRMWDGRETLIVVSSDLSHYHQYAQACTLDHITADAVLSLAGSLDDEQACGATAINGLLQVARRNGLRAELLDLRNSGDTAGDKSRVVGYAAFAFSADGLP